MPLTISHVAAVLPVRRLPIVLSAFIVGTMAPDFEYFVRLAPQSRWFHHFPGVLIFTLPCALAVLWLYHKVVKNPAIALLPEVVQRRLPEGVENFSFGGIRRFVGIVLSVLGGIATHVIWDMFTHIGTPIYRRWDFMQASFPLPVVGDLVGYKILQHASTLIGLFALCSWFAIWFRRSTPNSKCDFARNSGTPKVGPVFFMLTISGAAALAHASFSIGVPYNRGTLASFVGVGFVTAASTLWLEILIYSLYWRSRQTRSRPREGLL
jgi:hypothetical protein